MIISWNTSFCFILDDYYSNQLSITMMMKGGEEGVPYCLLIIDLHNLYNTTIMTWPKY